MYLGLVAFTYTHYPGGLEFTLKMYFIQIYICTGFIEALEKDLGKQLS